jgi:hypothetical protein
MDRLLSGNNLNKGGEIMNNHRFKIVNVSENNKLITITYITTDDPIPYSLFQCSFSIEDHRYSVREFLQYCIKEEDFLDIHGLYSSDFEQGMVDSLYQQIH